MTADTENAIYSKYIPSYDAPNFNPLAATGYLANRVKIKNVYPNGRYGLSD